MHICVQIDFGGTIFRAFKFRQWCDAFGGKLPGNGLVDAGEAIGIRKVDRSRCFVEIVECELTALG